MFNTHKLPFTAFSVLGAAAALTSACGHTGQAPDASAAPAALSIAQLKDHAVPDSCTLLSATEAENYVGALIMPPFRANDDGIADPPGDACAYRGAGARQLIIVKISEGSAAVGKILNDVPNRVGGVLAKAGQGNLAAATHRVMADAPNGPWDMANWIPGGTLFVTKGDAGANVDVSGIGGKQDDAIAVARLIVPRFDHPLDYDGAKAAVSQPKPKPHPGGPCDIVPLSAVEGAIGALDGTPAPDAGGSKCAYHVASAAGARTYVIDFVWQGGIKNFNMLKNGMATLGDAMGATIPSAGRDNVRMDPSTSKLVGGLKHVAGRGGGAPGAASQLGFKTDTIVQGPWDSAVLMHGTQLFAVKNDVMVSMDFQSADYERAKMLLAVVCSAI